MTHPQSLAEAKRLISNSERLVAYDRLQRELIPGWQLEFDRSKHQMARALPKAITGSLRDLATFILAAKANENAQCRLLGAEKHARDMHPMSVSEFGT